jgi:cytochrome c5
MPRLIRPAAILPGLAPLALAGAVLVQAPTPAPAAGLPPGPEAALVQAKCTACHGLELVTGQPPGRGAAWWRKTVQDMVDTHGAELTDAEQATISAFLARTQG